MSSSEYVNLSLQEQVPDLILRTDDVFSSDSEDDGKESEHSEEIEDMELDYGEEFETKGNSGWANAMAKILKTNAPKGQNNIVLAKAKKISDVLKGKKIPDVGFEIDGEVKEEKVDPATIKIEKTADQRRIAKQERKEWRLRARIKPSIVEKNRERTLAKIATKGIVQLFNTVKEHQRQIDKKLNEAGTERKREKVLNSVNKIAFLDMLMGPTGSTTRLKDSVIEDIKEEEGDKGSWNVLRDDFMMGAELKDWDKKL